MTEFTAATPRPIRGGPPRPVRVVLRRVNRLVRLLLRSPLHRVMSRQFLVLTYHGSRTGRVYSTPVMYIEYGGALLIAGGAPWWRNLRSGSTVWIRLRGQDRPARVELVTEADEVARMLERILPRNPVIGRMMRLEPAPNGGLDLADIEGARRRGLTVARLYPTAETTS